MRLRDSLFLDRRSYFELYKYKNIGYNSVKVGFSIQNLYTYGGGLSYKLGRSSGVN